MSESVLAASPYVERGVTIVAVVLGGILVAKSLLRPAARPATLGRWEEWLTWRREGALLAVIVAAAIVLRIVGWSRPLTGPFWFAEKSVLTVANMLREGTLWTRWVATFRTYQVSWDHDSALMLPVAAGVQWLLGPQLHLPVLVGAVWGVSAVVLAWALGRAAHSRTFGLLFAALLAVSPLNVVWSRLGGVHIGCVPHVLLVLLLAFVAGKRGSTVLTILAAAMAWASVYEYLATRVALPLALAALWAGLRASRRTAWRATFLFVLFAVTMVAIYSWAHPSRFKDAIWPEFHGYVGNNGEQSLTDLATRNAEAVRANITLSLARYFFVDRATDHPPGKPGPLFVWGSRFGGLCLLPVGVLGLAGLVWSVRRLRTGWLWLVLLAAGFAVPMLSLTQARRLLIFDLGWCALAAFGILALVASPLCRGLSSRAAAALMVAALTLLGTWSGATVFALNGRLDGGPRPIPFGDSGIGDGLTCLRCVQVAHEWQTDIEQGRSVVLVDSDLVRESSGSPAGLPQYGKIAALAAGKPGSFVELYPVMSNTDSQPSCEALFDDRTTDFVSYLIERLNAAGASTVIWHFERPTPWEEWFAHGLVEAGGELETFPTPLSQTGGMQVRTGWSPQSKAVEFLRQFKTLRRGPRTQCPVLRKVGTHGYSFSAVHIAGADDARPDGEPKWFVIGQDTSQYEDSVLPGEIPVGADVEVDHGAAETRLHVINGWGQYRVRELPSNRVSDRQEQFHVRHGFDCAARIGSNWWVVDPLSGTLSVSDGQADWIPHRPWIGVARAPGERLVLASADQELVVLNPNTRTEEQRFPAMVWPSRRPWAGEARECSRIVAGADWYGTFNNMTSLLTVYDLEGRRVGARYLDEEVHTGAPSIGAIGAQGRYLAVATGQTLTTFAVDLDEGCQGIPAKSASAAP